MSIEGTIMLTCDYRRECGEAVTHIDRKGYIYCTEHGEMRRYAVPCRKLTQAELTKLKAGQTIKRY